MSIPNTVVKIINKYGAIVEFDIDKIIRSIASAIIDVVQGAKWSAEKRAEIYAEKIRQRIYREFYDINYLKTDFIIKFINFNAEERERRMDNAFVTKRIVFLFLQRFQDILNVKNIANYEKELKDFISKEIKSAKIDPKYTEGLFPMLDKNNIKNITEFLLKKILILNKEPVTSDLLYPSREYIQDTIEKELKDIGEVEVGEGYMIYREGRKKIHENDISDSQFTNNGIHKVIVRKTLSWNIEHECDTIFSLNEWVYGRKGKDLRELIKLSEERYRKDVLSAINKIVERKSEIKVVIIAGPSCSNKTTTTVITGIELKKIGLKLKQLNVDDYFKDLTDQPKDEYGDYDFEMPEAIDMELLNKHLELLLAGKEVKKPRYNFKAGSRDRFEPFHLEEDEIILIDCLHGLYHKLTEAVPSSKKFRIYIESMNVIRDINGAFTRWADVRMLKRMIRDVQHRGYSTESTLAHWPYVRKGELKHIIPYILATDDVINSGLPYELTALKKSLEGRFPSKEFIDELRIAGRLDQYIRGIRTATLLETVAEMPALDIIPPTSPIREFIGGSEYIIPHNE
ncbi:MAG: response regulator SirA [Candidatus Hydrogenedentota bacterium]